MASNLDGDDLQTDGEILVKPEVNLKFASVISSTCYPETKSQLHDGPIGSSLGLDSKTEQKTSRCESLGYGSLNSQSLSGSIKLSHTLETLPEQESKLCKNDFINKEVTGIVSKFSDLDVTDDQLDDEGIDSLIQEETDSFILEEELLEVDSDGDTLLHNAIIGEQISMVFALIELYHEFNLLNLQNELFQTPLHLAVLTCLSGVVDKLVQCGADVFMRDQQGNTALHIACRLGNKDIVESIVESVKTNKTKLHKLFTVRNSEGLTCLHIAADKKCYKIMGYLFANGADINIGDAKSGRTILHYAVERRDMETVKALLTHHDIDVDCVTFKGESPLFIAYWRNYQDIVKKLKSKGAYFSFDLVDTWDEE